MLFLQRHHIVDLYCWIDTNLPTKKDRIGRPSILTDSEIVTILVWNTLVLHQKTLKELHQTVEMYHQDDFPKIPKYPAFVRHCHRVTPYCFALLQQLLCDTEPIRLMDATMLPVCKLHRADSHKVARGVADFGKNWQGWHFGFKLHASISLQGSLCGSAITPANIYDAQVMPYILNEYANVAVGDTLYGAKVMGQKIWSMYGTVIIAPPHPSQKKKIAAPWQVDLLSLRSKIESVFDVLKEHLHLVSSFPRSVNGFLLHYVRILLSYQILSLSI